MTSLITVAVLFPVEVLFQWSKTFHKYPVGVGGGGGGLRAAQADVTAIRGGIEYYIRCAI